ncbi:MAG: hypothetical protein HY906_05520, partial [Deltaproteobacteria bacterium]|nr:hypothetical protein [Deltaproteobacteria bacterium]
MDTTTGRDHYTARVTGRTVLARELQQPRWGDAVKDAGLLPADLAYIQQQGEESEKHDRAQHDELARQRQDISAVVAARRQVGAEEEQLRNRLAAVIDDLARDPGTVAAARWLATVTFNRYRIRVTSMPPDPEAAEEAQPITVRERVTRKDRLSWAQSLAHFALTLLEPDHAAIGARLEARGMGRARLQALAAAAEDLVGRLGGKAALTPVEATRLEAEAAHAQRLRWQACYR